MPQMRIRDAATFLGVSDDTVRRWIDSERLPAHREGSGPAVVDGTEVTHAGGMSGRHWSRIARVAATTSPSGNRPTPPRARTISRPQPASPATHSAIPASFGSAMTVEPGLSPTPAAPSTQR